MSVVRPKKHLGQHFLADKNIAGKIVQALSGNASAVLEIGPGMGILSDFLLDEPKFTTYLIDIDTESVSFLRKKYPQHINQIIEGDFLKFDFSTLAHEKIAVIGNFPYNISSQILFKILENRTLIPEMVGMFQKEVAERVAAKPGGKEYGILSVLVQAFYNIEYLFTVNPQVFNPPPKVKSAVIRLTRNTTDQLACDEKLFFEVVKAAFNQRRKTLRNALRKYFNADNNQEAMLDLRAERLSVNDFVFLVNQISVQKNKHNPS